MSKKFIVRWQAYDGYAGGDRLQSFNVGASDIDDDMDEKALSELYNELVQEAFTEKVSASGGNEEEFIEWAKEVIASRSQPA